MEKPINTPQPPLQQLSAFIFTWIGVFILFQVGVLTAAYVVIGKNFVEELTKPSSMENHLWFFRIAQSISSILVFFVPALLITFRNREKPMLFFSLDRPPNVVLMLICFVVVVFCMPFILYTYNLNQSIPVPKFLDDLFGITQSEARGEHDISIMMRMQSPAQLAFNLVMFALLPAVCEEFFFRGGFQRLFARISNNGHLAVLVTAIFFSVVHADFHGFIPRAILGVVLGYMYYWSRNLWLPIFAHMVYNGSQVVAVYALGDDKINKATSPEGLPMPAVLISMVLLFLTMSWLYRRTMGKWEKTLEKTDD